MKETIKTVVLVVLIVTSLVQTYFLAFSEPEFDLIDHHEYVEVDWIGPQKTLPSFMMPNEIVVYDAEEHKHTAFYPYFQFYDLILNHLRERTFDGFREVIGQEFQIEALKETESWLELRFSQPLPAETLAEFMAIRDDSIHYPDNIQRFLLTTDGDEELRAFVFTEVSTYEVISTDLSRRHLDQYVAYGQQMPRYEALWLGKHYVPEEPVVAKQVTLPFETFTAEQLQTSLFADPGASRRLLEQDHTEIFTDGKRGLEVDRDQYWMRYSDPSAPVEARPQDRLAGLNKALQFVNRHGGWHGEFLLEEVMTHSFGAAETYVFRQYYAALPNETALPILSSKDGRYGHVEVTVQQGIVTIYERSLMAIEPTPVSITEVELPGPEDLQKRLEAVNDGEQIEDIFLAYYPVMNEDTIDLIPRWVAKISGSDYIYLHE